MVKDVLNPKGLRVPCKFCHKTFSTQQTRSEHHRKIHPDEFLLSKGTRLRGDYPCLSCGLKLGSSESLRKHKKRKHAVEVAEIPRVEEIAQDQL